MTSSHARPRVLIVDDEAAIRRFLRIALVSEDCEVMEAGSGREALRLLSAHVPNLIVLDLGLPDIDGQAVLREIRARIVDLPIIVLSVRTDELEKVEALDAGANDYVTKPFGLPEFLARVRGLLRQPPSERLRSSFHDERLAVDLPTHTVRFDDRSVHLTRKEFSVLSLLIQHAGRVVTQRHMLQEIWGASHASDTHYLRIIVGRLRQKLRDDPTDPHYIQTEPGIGYRFAGPLESSSDEAAGH